ncbi:MAG: hypothetical protein GY694_22700 [Gammaproteobacteria bacterium]|nr:hypothetical protein [Gammaproteobacteria bacterium]
MEYLQAVSTWLGAFVINHLLPKSFRSIIEPESDLSSFIGAFVAVLLIFCILFVVVYLDNQLQIDSCLDSSGRWNYDINICEFNDRKS